MTLHQHAVSISEFARYLRGMTALLDPAGGWYGAFCRRDPEGMRACLAGAEIPPWDVVESLFTDLASVRGAAFAERESVRAAELYAASAVAHDRRPGGRQRLGERLELMLREQANAAHRLHTARAGGESGTVDAVAVAWARDDHARASARCTELRGRLAATATATDGWDGAQREPGPGAIRQSDEADPPASPSAEPEPARRPPAAPARRKPRGARFAGLEAVEESPAAASPLPAPPVTAALPRGARFGGAPRGGGDRTDRAEATQDPATAQSVRATVATLVRLRAQGRGGEAHAVLCEAAGKPAGLLPVLAVELHRAGLGADWSTLLWEVSSLPPAGLAAAVDALAGAGRLEDCEHLLRQGVARPAAEIADAAIALERAGRGPQALALLGAYVRVRSPQDAASVAASDPRLLVPHLLAAARTVSEARERDVEHALRVAGIA